MAELDHIFGDINNQLRQLKIRKMEKITQTDLDKVIQLLQSIQEATRTELSDKEEYPVAVGRVLGANRFNKTQLKYVINMLKGLEA